VKLKAWAEREGVHYLTAYRWFREGTLPVPARQTQSGTILVDVAPDQPTRAVVYARVSSHDQRADLERQIARLTTWATQSGIAVGSVVSEVGSGMNGRRVKFRRLLSDASLSPIIVEHRDRLARFGVEYLESALAAQGRRIIVVDPGEQNVDLVRDMIEVLTSFCARLYGARGARNRALRAVTSAKREPGA
jgi:putative resolvase